MSTPAPSERPVALVTGAARRIGAATSRTLHAAGFDILLHHHASAGEAEALAAELNATRPGSAHALAADLRDFDRTQRGALRPDIKPRREVLATRLLYLPTDNPERPAAQRNNEATLKRSTYSR